VDALASREAHPGHPFHLRFCLAAGAGGDWGVLRPASQLPPFRRNIAKPRDRALGQQARGSPVFPAVYGKADGGPEPPLWAMRFLWHKIKGSQTCARQ